MRRAVVKCALYASVLIAAGLFGFWLARSKDQHQEEHASACASGKPSYWYDPTFPDRHFDAPGKSPFMDMELVPKCPERNGSTIEGATPGLGPAGGIAVDARIVQSLGVRLAPVEQGTLARIVDTVGSVALDERRIEVVQVRAPGWVEVLDVRAAGDPVRRGQRLAAVYSPELLTAQQEFLIAISTGDADLIGAARQRLVLSGLPDAQIARVERSGQPERRVEYFAPFDGFVTDLGTRQGASVERATTLFQLADLSTVWINAEVPETQMEWSKSGDRVEAEVAALPGERFEGTIDYIYPELTLATRTLKVRVVLANPALHLKPGMFASLRLFGTPVEQATLIPTEAVIRTGLRNVAIVADDATHFRPVLVRVGSEYGGKSQVLDGLMPGQQVVASGQFLIDSEASLRGAFDRLTGAGDAREPRADGTSDPSPEPLR